MVGKFNTCTFGGLRHNFEPRYNSTWPAEPRHIPHGTSIEFINALKNQTYVRDVCVWCGKTVEHQ